MGVDNDPKMIKIANNFFANRKYKNYKFKKCNIQNFQSKKKFIPNVNLKKTKNPLKSYILFDNKKNKILVNRLNIVRNFYFIEAKKI